jgi:transcriptional regulator with XRE-family HTH domain
MKTEKFITASDFFMRVEKGMKNRGISTLKELSEKVKISQATIQGWKKAGSIPQRRTLQTLSEVLNVPPEWLLGNNNAEPNWNTAGAIMKDIDAESEARFIAESRKNMTQRLEKYSEGIKGMLASMQRVNPEMRRKLKGMIIDLLDDFEVKCDADAPNVKIVAASEAVEWDGK